jgi:hypothetical protein
MFGSMTSSVLDTVDSWYRNRRRCVGVSALNGFLALIFVVDPTILILHFAKMSGPWFAIPAAELAVLIAFVCRSAWAGMVLTGDGVTLRSPLGRLRRVPWARIVAFQVVHRPGEYLPALRCDDGRILHTIGCSFKSRQQAADAVGQLEADRLSRSRPADSSAPWPDLPKIARTDFLRAEIKIFGPLAGMIAGGLALIAVGIIGAVFLYSSVAPALRAEHRLGTAGAFVARSEACGRGGCWWTGDFTPLGGQTRHGISLAEPDASLDAGQSVTALDTGPAGRVYLPGDSWPVTNNVLGVIMCVVSAVFGAALLVMAWHRERRRRRHAAANAAGGDVYR